MHLDLLTEKDRASLTHVGMLHDTNGIKFIEAASEIHAAQSKILLACLGYPRPSSNTTLVLRLKTSVEWDTHHMSRLLEHNNLDCRSVVMKKTS